MLPDATALPCQCRRASANADATAATLDKPHLQPSKTISNDEESIQELFECDHVIAIYVVVMLQRLCLVSANTAIIDVICAIGVTVVNRMIAIAAILVMIASILAVCVLVR